MNIVENLNDITAVKAVMQLYIDGADGDVAKLNQAFHENAQMFGHVGDVRRDMPITQFIAGVGNAGPNLTGPNYRFEMPDIKVAGLAAVVTLIEQDYRGCEFVNFFTLAKINDTWKIVSKTYTSTGGPFK
ncbi:MAG: nuclear transport factor 2 family protein [Burkholderiaceae bacterium]